MNRLYKALLLALLCVCSLPMLRGQAKAAEQARGSDQAKLKMVLVLSRHGVRSPTWTLDRLNAYSSLPWPAWSVPPGYLTTRGFDLMKLMGAYDRAAFAKAGLFAAEGCGAASDAYIWADTDQRTLQSGRALADGLFPGCAAKVNSLGEGENDPLFHAPADTLDPAAADALFAQFSNRFAAVQPSSYSGLLIQMNRVLQGCRPDSDCTPQQPPQSPLLVGNDKPAHGKGDHLVNIQGPLAQGSTFAEDFLLEYTEGMPIQSVAWGKIDEAQLIKFISLHSIYFGLMHRTPALAKIESAGMLNQIERTLQQGVEGKPVSGAIGPPGKKLVLLVGHDTNIGPIAELLGLHWDLDGRADDTPPGTELVFELWQTPQGAYRVRTSIAMQTIRQMREVQTLTQANPPAQQVVTPPACGTKTNACGWEDFRAITEAVSQNK